MWGAHAVQIRRRLREVGDSLRMLRPLQDERSMLLDRLRELQPHTAKPIKWAGTCAFNSCIYSSTVEMTIVSGSAFMPGIRKLQADAPMQIIAEVA